MEDRKQGKNSLYRLKDRQLGRICCMPPAAKFPKRRTTLKALQLVLEKRRDKVRGYFDELAGKVRPGLRAGAVVERPCRDPAAVDAAAW